MILVQVCQCSSAKFASEPGLHYFQKKLQRQYLYLLQHLDSSLNTGPGLLKLLGVLAPLTVLHRLLELHLSLSSFSWEAPPSQLPGSICPSSPPSAPSSIWCRCAKSTSSWALASWCLSCNWLHLPECGSLFLTSCYGTSLSCSLCVSGRLFVSDLREFSLYKSYLPQYVLPKKEIFTFVSNWIWHLRHLLGCSIHIFSASFASRTIPHFFLHNICFFNFLARSLRLASQLASLI